MFIGNSVKDDDLALTAQETVNWYIESQKEGARNSKALILSLIHISEPTRLLSISYAVFCLKKKNTNHININTFPRI
mgnify:CR=1 FL=1